ncbi:MAG: hypothetical protein Q4G61_02410 [Tissierellia bacterium]|nr:hypothetical protein [Tissierellia bacterium]
MKQKKANEYSIKKMMQILPQYYLFAFLITGVILFGLAYFFKVLGEPMKGDFSGPELFTGFFFLLLGWTSFRETFWMMLQNGISRRTMLVSLLVAGAVGAVLGAVLDTVLIKWVESWVSGYHLVYHKPIIDAFLIKGWAEIPITAFFRLLTNLGMYITGTLLGALFYRMEGRVKTFFIAFCVLLVMAFGGLYSINEQAVDGILSSVIQFTSSNALIYTLSSLFRMGLLAWILWIVTSRAPIKTIPA